MTKNALNVLMLALFAIVAVEGAPKPQCRTFKEIYGNEASAVPGGKKLCENMWGGAFKYEKDETKGFAMHFYDKPNPNIAMVKALNDLDANGMLYGAPGGHEDAPEGVYGLDQCHLDYLHKDKPGKPEYAIWKQTRRCLCVWRHLFFGVASVVWCCVEV